MPSEWQKIIPILVAATAMSVLVMGCAQEPETGSSPVTTTTYEFLDDLENAEIIADNELKVSEKELLINDESRSVLYEHPDSVVIFNKVSVSENSALRFGFGISQEAWDKEGDGVLFEINVFDESSRDHSLFSSYINPKNNTDDRKWFDQQIDLSDFAGQEVSFSFETESNGNSAYDWAGWSSPIILSSVSP